MYTDDQSFLAEFGQVLGLHDKKKSSDSQGGSDLLSNLLSVTKVAPKPIVEQVAKPKKKQDTDNSHAYLERALKPIKQGKQKTPLFTPRAEKNENKEAVYRQKIKQAKTVLQNTSKQKKYKPKVVDYLGVGEWNNFKKDGNQRAKQSLPQNEKRQKSRVKQKRKQSPSPQKTKKSQQRQKQRQKDRQRDHKQSRIMEQDRSQKFRIRQEERQRERQKQRQKARTERQRETQQEKQKHKAKERERQRQEDRGRQRQKQRQRTRQKQSQRQRQYQRERRQKQRKQRQYQRQRRYNQLKKSKKHRRQQDQYDQDDGFIVDDDQQDQGIPAWKKALNKLTNKQKREMIYRERDREEILESSARQILGEDRISARIGREEEEADWRREEQEKRRKAERRKRQEERERRR